MFQFKRKEKLDKYSTRGMIYTGISLLGMGYEIFINGQTRPFLIISYSVIIVIGLAYIFYVKPLD